jgi:hypothetical protein
MNFGGSGFGGGSSILSKNDDPFADLIENPHANTGIGGTASFAQ